MTDVTTKAECFQCGTRVPDIALSQTTRQRCPVCAATERRITIRARDVVSILGDLRYKHRELGGRRPRLEGREKDEVRYATGRTSHVSRLIDRANDRYFKVVTDSRTGEVLHQCDEPLSEHRDHGAARKTRTVRH